MLDGALAQEDVVGHLATLKKNCGANDGKRVKFTILNYSMILKNSSENPCINSGSQCQYANRRSPRSPLYGNGFRYATIQLVDEKGRTDKPHRIIGADCAINGS